MDFRMFPGVQRISDEWFALYKIRTIVERSINYFKTNICLADLKTRNHATTKADVLLAGIASRITVIAAHRTLEDHVSNEQEINNDITDLEIPEEHKEFIQACLMVLGINDSELTNLHIEKVYDDIIFEYSYQTDTKILSFSIAPGDFWMEEYEPEEMKTDEGTDFMKPIDETQNYKFARKALDMMCGDEWTDASAWYYCQSIPEGYLQNDKYAYIFVDDKGKDLWFSYRYGETYPCRIWNSSFELFTDNLERVEEHGLYEHFGVEIEDHLIQLDIETGKVISDN